MSQGERHGHITRFGGVPVRVDLTGISKKHRGNRQLTSPKSNSFRDGGSFLDYPDFFLFTMLFTLKSGVQ